MASTAIADLRLTSRQQEAVESWGRGDVCVVAGPGSGKTRVLVERFRWLVQVKGVPVRRILAITFTEKAAAHMRQRLVESFPVATPERKAVERAYISTIHGFCARLLREHAVEAAVDPAFQVFDEWEAAFELHRAIEEALEQEYLARPERVREFLGAFGCREVPGALYGLYQALRAAGVTVEQARQAAVASDPAALWRRIEETLREVAALPATGWNLEQRQALEEALAQDPAGLTVNLAHLKPGSRQRELLKRLRVEMLPEWRAALLYQQHARNRGWFLDALARAGSIYREAKRAAGALDYADLEEGAIRLLESTGGRLRTAFSYVLMDEYQDTNPLQARLVGLLRGRDTFFAVGDINQSIYGFRHADPTVFRDYRDQTRQAGGHVVELGDNFRSRPEVLRAVLRVIAGAEGIEPQALAAGRPFAPATRPCLEVLTVQGEDSDAAGRLEARHVAARIRTLVAEGAFAYRDIAILLRSGALVRLYEKTLRELGVPCEITEGRGFYDAQEVSDLLAFLRVLLNPQDEISLAAVLRSPLAGVSDDTLLQIKRAHGSLAAGLAQELPEFHARLGRFRRSQHSLPLDRLLGRILTETGYEAWLREQAQGAHAVANVRKLMALARRFQARGPGGPRAFLERVEDLRREEAREADARPPEQSADAVEVMTIHAAKGLEFPVVFVAALGRGPKKDTDPVVFLPGHGVGMRWRDPETGDEAPDAVARAVGEELQRRQQEEEQRLLYVAMTRAEQLLVLSAGFGPKVESRHWVPYLTKNLGIDLKVFDNTVREAELFRILQTNQEPVLAGQPPPPRAASVEPIVLERPDPGDQSDTAVSATSVALFAQCPRKYYLSRYLGFSSSPNRDRQGADPDPDELDPTDFGRHVHALLAGQLPPEQALPEALVLAANFHASELGRRAAAATRIEREQSFLVELEGRLVSGQIDLWFEESGQTFLIDYKTDQVTAEQAADRAADYALQLRLYALAIERLAGRTVERAVLYFLRPNVVVDVALDAAAARGKVEELCQAQSRLGFPLREGPHCRRCPYFGGLCPAR
jgi:ATP-dependent exoDNAse (exonuclease V) beta subunit